MNAGSSLIPKTESGPPAKIDRKNLLSGLGLGVVTATGFGLGGFSLIYDNTGSMGSVLFILLPIATGFATALIAKRWNLVLASLIISLILCSAVLLATGKEGWVCVLMSAPLILAGLAIGGLLGTLFRVYVLSKFDTPGTLKLIALLLIPLFLMGANSAETGSRRTPRFETITNRLTVQASPDIAWNTIKSMDRVSATKGLLMRIGLPVPVSCVLEREAVGGRRICYFESGFIEERITEWNPPQSMKLDIVASDVPGRPWLTFKDASYEITQEQGHTVITRTTTIVSRLSPAWYWRTLEKIGVETEHAYLFEELGKRLNGVK